MAHRRAWHSDLTARDTVVLCAAHLLKYQPLRAWPTGRSLISIRSLVKQGSMMLKISEHTPAHSTFVAAPRRELL